MQRDIRFDCAYYRGSRPCDPHKKHGVTCSACEHYAPARERIAIIKLGAMGDVLRTAALLPDIRSVHPDAELTWITLADSVPVVGLVHGIDRVNEAASAPIIAGREFDCLYNFDNADEGVALAAAIPATQKRGFRIGPSGHCEGVYNGGDARLFELGLWDDMKRRNRASYLTLLAATAGLTYSGQRPNLVLKSPKMTTATCSAPPLRPRVGINTDAGTRWLRKQWNLPYVERAVEAFVARNYSVTLFGGDALQPFNDTLAARFAGKVEAARTAGDFDALCHAISSVDVLLTGDTLAMHVAWALGVPLVVLFGPTSWSEIDVHADDIKLFADDLDCLGCYLHTCEVSPNCMDRLTPESVVSAVESRLSAALEVVPE